VEQLWDVLDGQLGAKATAEVNVEAYLSHCALDIIGLAGFGYDFATLSSGGNELAAAFETVFGVAQQPAFLDVLAFLVPGFRHIVRARILRSARMYS
jgi:hypothetical protein